MPAKSYDKKPTVHYHAIREPLSHQTHAIQPLASQQLDAIQTSGYYQLHEASALRNGEIGLNQCLTAEPAMLSLAFS